MRSQVGIPPNPDFNSKIRRKMARDRRAVLVTTADKLAVREFVANLVGEDKLTRLIDSGPSAEAIAWESLPREFVVKVNHASGGIIIVTEAGDRFVNLSDTKSSKWPRLKLHPDSLDVAGVTSLLNTWLTQDYSWERGSDRIEWAYSRIAPKLIVEECLIGKNGQLPIDYKFFVFHGEPAVVQVDVSREHDHRRSMFSMDWAELNVSYHFPKPHEPPNRPDNFGVMVEIASIIGNAVGDFARVDLYSFEERVLFGEITHYPGGGHELAEPESFLKDLGLRWFPEY